MDSLKRARKARGMSLAEVGERSGLHAQAVARAERAGTDPRVSTVVAIANALNVPICKLVDERAHHERHRQRRPR